MRQNFQTLLFLSAMIIGLSCHSSAAWAGNTYYIDYSNGSDSNNGTGKTSAFQHAPGMQGCASKCAAVQPKAGDRYTLRGGVTWPNAALGWNWQWSGSSTQPVYIGVDQTWFAGSGWARPVLNGGGKVVAGNNDFINLQGSPSYVTIDNIEFTGLYWTGSPAYGSAIYIEANGSTNIAVTNSYFHGWTHTTAKTIDAGRGIQGDTGSPYNSGSYVANCVFDGSDTDGVSFGAIYMWPDVHTSVFNTMANGVVGRLTLVHDNLVENISNSFDPGTHSNAVENTGSGGLWMYNNLIENIKAGASVLNSITPGGSDYYYNNLISATTAIALTLDTDLGGTQNSAEYLYNNTFQGSGFLVRFEDRGNGPVGTGVAQNNHFITDGQPVCFNDSADGCVIVTNSKHSNNLTMTNATAQKQGYTSSNDYSPTKAHDPTVGSGLDFSSLCESQLAAMCDATTLGVIETSAHTAQSPARMPNARPSGTPPWNVGAYEFEGSLNAPGSLTAMAGADSHGH
jgi:hypothetical protein